MGNEFEGRVSASRISGAAHGITARFQSPYEGPYHITKSNNPPSYSISDPERNLREYSMRGL
jgi:hypothetical protein